MPRNLKNIYIALMHYPVKRDGRVITSSITNLDMHDISRVAATYGLGGYFVVHPDQKMRSLAGKLASHWIEGTGSDYNPDRSEAFRKLHIVPDLDDAKRRILDSTGEEPLVIGTTAMKKSNSFPVSHLRGEEKKPLLFLFGTAGGLDDQLLENIDLILEPIDMGIGYNHLSVRSAVSIFIDRLAMDV